MKKELQFNLPVGWSVVDLGDLLKRITNGLTCKQEKETPGIPITRIETISNGVVDFERVRYVREIDNAKKDNFLLHRGDILFSHINSDLHLGKTAVVTTDKPLLHGMNLLLLRTKRECLDPYYLHYLLNYYRRSGTFMAIAQHAVNQSSLNQKKINSIKIPLAPIDQQQRIVAEIEKQFSRLDEAVANLKRIKANLKRYKAAVLKAAVEGKLTEAWRKAHPDVEPASKLLARILIERQAKWSGKGKYKKPVGAEETGLPPLPKGWAWAKLEQLGMIVGGFTKNPKRAKLTRKLPYLRVANVYANELRLEEIEHIGVQDTELEKLLLQKGDLLIVEGNGSKDQIGRLAIWDGSIDMCVHQNHLIKVRLVIGSMDKWILFWLLSPSGRHCIEKVSSSTSGLYTLSVNKVGALPIIFPSIAEQEQIITEVERRLSVIEKLETTVETNLTRANRLRQAILQSAFIGQLVPQGLHESATFPLDQISKDQPLSFRHGKVLK